MYKNVKKKMHFTLQLMIHLKVQLRGLPDGAPKGALSDRHKDAQYGVCEISLKEALELALVLHLWL